VNRIVLRGATVITMASGHPDSERLDVLVEGGKIAGIAKDLPAAGAETIDFSGRILIPGLINAHLHSWQAALRCVGIDWTLEEYLVRAHARLSSHLTPDDMRIAAYGCALNQIGCGTTTLGDWSHNTRTPAHADATVEGLAASGIRAVLLHGMPHRLRQGPHPISEVDRLLDGPIARHDLLSLGMAIPGPQLSSAAVALADFRAAHERGLLVSMHQSGGQPGAAWAAVRDAGLIGPRTNIVHGNDIPDDWLATLADAGATFTVTPENELGQGHGIPITGRLLRLGAAPSLGTDVDSVVSGEVQIAARIALAQQRGLDHARHRETTGLFSPMPTITAKQALGWATVEGARALGLADHVGRLEPGMQADIVVIDTRALNLWPAHNPVAAVLQSSTANIEAVMIAGQWRKRDFALVGVDVDGVRNDLHRSGARLVAMLESRKVLPRIRHGVAQRVVHRTLVKQSRDQHR